MEKSVNDVGKVHLYAVEAKSLLDQKKKKHAEIKKIVGTIASLEEKKKNM